MASKITITNIYDLNGKLVERDFINRVGVTVEKDFYNANKLVTKKEYFDPASGVLTQWDLYTISEGKSYLSEKNHVNSEGEIVQKDFVVAGKITEKDFYNEEGKIYEKYFYKNGILLEKDFLNSAEVITQKDYYTSGKVVKTALYSGGNLTEINFYSKNILTKKELYIDDVLTQRNFYAKGLIKEIDLYVNSVLVEKDFYNSSTLLTERDFYTNNKIIEKDYVNSGGITFQKDYLDSKGKVLESGCFNATTGDLIEKNHYAKGVLTSKDIYEGDIISKTNFYTKNVVTQENIYAGGELSEKNFYSKKVLTQKEFYSDDVLTQRNIYSKGVIKESDIFTSGILTEKDYYIEGILTQRDTIASDGSVGGTNYYDGHGDLIDGTGVIAKDPYGDYAVIYGQPNYWGDYLDSKQGDNELRYMYDCGLVACENVLIEMGIFPKRSKYTVVKGVDTQESEVVQYAAENNLCDTSNANPTKNGSTYLSDMQRLLSHFRVAADYMSGTITEIADYIEEGKCVIAGVASSILWNMQGKAVQDHAITITGVAYDLADPDEIEGFYICDSGRRRSSDSDRFVSYDLMEEAFTYGSDYDIGELLVTTTEKSVMTSPTRTVYSSYDINSIISQVGSYTSNEDAQLLAFIGDDAQQNLQTLVVGSVS